MSRFTVSSGPTACSSVLKLCAVCVLRVVSAVGAGAPTGRFEVLVGRLDYHGLPISVMEHELVSIDELILSDKELLLESFGYDGSFHLHAALGGLDTLESPCACLDRVLRDEGLRSYGHFAWT